MNLVAHISDLHFGRERPEVLTVLLKDLAQLQPDLLIISGDLTQRAKPGEFLAAARFLKNLEWPYLIVPGNHDLAAYNLVERFYYPWRKWRQFVSTELEPLVAGEGLIAAGINTARKWGSALDWSRGHISASQTGAVIERLGTRSDPRLRLLVAHHPFWLPEEQEYRHLIGGRDAALQKLSRAGIDIILSGHVHLAYTRVLEGIIISHAGTTTSDRLLPGHPNSYNLIRGDRRSLSIDMMVWNGSAFTRQESRTYKHDETGWFMNKGQNA